MSWLKVGNLRGPQGPVGAPGATGAQGPQGPPGSAADGYLTEIRAQLSITVPAGWLALNGQTIINGQTLYPDLWALLPGHMKSGSDILMPDARDRVLQGWSISAGPGILDGANTRAIPLGALPSHSHGMAHQHAIPTHNHTMPHTHGIDHSHPINHDHPNASTSNSPVPTSFTVVWVTSTQPPSAFALTTSASPNITGTGADYAHVHDVDIPPYSGSSGAPSVGTSGAASSSTTSSTAASNTGAASTELTGAAGTGGQMDMQQAALRVIWMMRAAFV